MALNLKESPSDTRSKIVCAYGYSEDNIQFEKLFGHLDGIKRILKMGSNILIKPNLAVAKEHSTGATTSPYIVKNMIQYLKNTVSPKQISIVESSWRSEDTVNAFKVTGFYKIAREEEVDLVDLKKDVVKSVEVQNGKILKRVHVYKTVADADAIINIPVLKAHTQTKLTVGMKNLKGCIPDYEKKKFHALDLHKSLADLNTVIKPILTIVDGTIGDVFYEMGGHPLKMDTIVIGQDIVAIDSVCAQLLGYDPKQIEYIRYATELGIGTSDSSYMKISFESQDKSITSFDELKRKISMLTRSILDKELNIFNNIIDANACSCCITPLVFAMKKLKEHDFLLDSIKIIIGQTASKSIADVTEGRCIYVGKCTEKLSDRFHIKGCPPAAHEIYIKMKNFLREMYGGGNQ